MEPGFTRGKQMTESSRILWAKELPRRMEQNASKDSGPFQLAKVKATVHWWYNQKILCLPGISWALCVGQPTQGRKPPVQSRGREGILCDENTTFTVQSCIWQEAISFLFCQIQQSLVAGRQGRKKKPKLQNPLLSVSDHFAFLHFCAVSYKLTHFPESKEGLFSIKLFICRVLPAFSRK